MSHDVQTRYLVIGCARSGTSITHHVIAGHPAVSALSSEVGPSPLFTTGAAVFTYGQGCTSTEIARSYSALFDAVSGLNAGVSTRARGMKCAIASSSDAQRVVDCVRTHLADLRIILVTRANLLEQYCSLLRARETGIWYSRQRPEKSDADVKIWIDRKALTTYVRDCLSTNRILRSLSSSNLVLGLCYESDIAAGGLDAYYRTFDFLGLQSVPITWCDSEKVSPQIERFVTNARDARSWYAEIESQAEAVADDRRDRTGTIMRNAADTGRRALRKARRIAAIIRE